MGIRAKATLGAALCALALAVAQPAGAASAPAGPVAHASSGCAGATVLTPRDGAVATAQAMGMTSAADGFYARAAESHATWLSTMSCSKTSHTHALKPATITTAAAGAGAGAGVRNAGYLSSNWSGYQINGTSQYVQSGWTVPTVTQPMPAYSTTGYYSSIWSGIGGGFNAGNGALIQSGTAEDVNASGQASYYAWYEIVGGTHDTGGEIRINNLPVHPGDAVGSGVEWTPSGGAILGVCNFSTGGGCINFTLASSAPGTSEEWIVEAPYFNGVLPLADFHSVNFVNACWQTTFQSTGTCSSIAAGGPQPISLEQYVFKAYQVLAQPQGGLTNNGQNFTDYYIPPERCPTC
ncbi:G1 family glutamic endopeptidase [Catenulispora subtropica]|uniref:Peptidase A4 family protein n=1 Tax=Catenulispora subtropica TaxID=450798 RepID=A0ABN2T7F1_9ACTN